MSLDHVEKRATEALEWAIVGDREKAYAALESFGELVRPEEVFAACSAWVGCVREAIGKEVKDSAYWALQAGRTDGQRVPENDDHLWVGRFVVAGLNDDLPQQWAIFAATPDTPTLVSRVWLLLDLAGLLLREKALAAQTQEPS